MISKLAIPIRYKVLTASLLVTTCVVGLITFSMANLFHVDKKAYIHDLTSTMVLHTTEEIKSLLNGYRQKLEFFARIMANTKLSDSTKRELLNEIFYDFPELYSVTAILKQGEKITFFDPQELNNADIDKKDLVAFRARNPLPLKKLYSDNIFIANSTITKKLPSFTMAIAYPTSKKDMIVISGEVHMQKLLDIVQRSSTFKTYILDSDNHLFTHANPVWVTDPKVAIDIDNLSNVRNQQSLGTTREYEHSGMTMIGGFAEIGIQGLLTVIEIPKSTAYLTARSLLKDLTYISLAVLIATVLISLFWAQRLTRPIENLSRATKQVGQGDFGIKVDINAKDEIGALAESFNDMAIGLKDREEKLKQANAALLQSEKLSALGQISAGVAHEVKNPLTGILGYAQLAKRKLTNDDPLMENMLVIEQETKRCKSIIDNLMKFARAEKSEHISIDINESIKRAITITNHQLSLNNVRIHEHLQPGLPLVSGNCNQIEQVIMNLLINAQQAMNSDGGRISVTTQLNGDDLIEIRVQDNGPGIPESIQSKIFDPFFTTKNSAEGTGLGLSVSYGIIKDHNGEIRIESSADQGTLFIINLPIPGQTNQFEEGKLTGTDS